jgi:hypothetical protein
MSTHMLSVHRETLARVPNAKVGRDNLDISIYGMEGVPSIVIQEKMISRLKKKIHKLQQHIQKTTNLKEKLDPKYIKEMKEANEFFRIFNNYTTNMEAAAGLKYFTEQPQAQDYDQSMHPPQMEANKGPDGRKRDSKFQSKLDEEKSNLPIIMKEEMKQAVVHQAHLENVVKPALNLNISKTQKDSSKKKGKQEIMTFVSKLSPEEKRGQMEKYRYDEKKIKSKLKNLQMSIADKLKAFSTT